MEPRSSGFGARLLESRGRAQPAVGDDERLEESAHFALTLAHQPRPRPLEFLRVVKSGALGKRFCPQIDADAAKEIALIDRPINGCAGGARAAGHGREIDMRG